MEEKRLHPFFEERLIHDYGVKRAEIERRRTEVDSEMKDAMRSPDPARRPSPRMRSRTCTPGGGAAPRRPRAEGGPHGPGKKTIRQAVNVALTGSSKWMSDP